MAGLWADDFGWYTSTAQLLRYWSSKTEVGTITLGAYGRNGGPGIRLAGALGDDITIDGLPASGNVAIQFGCVRILSDDAVGDVLMGIRSGGGFQTTLNRKPDGTIGIYNTYPALTGLIASSTYVLPTGPEAFVRLAWKVTLAAAGAVKVYVWEEGDTAPRVVINASGVDTRALGTSVWDGLHFGAATTPGSTDWSEVGGMDGSGTRWNDLFVRPPMVSHFHPIAAGAATQWTPNIGANFEAVDDAAADDDTTRVASSTVGQDDLYAFETVPLTRALGFGVLVPVAKQDAGGTNHLTPLARQGSTTTAGTALTLTTSYLAKPTVYQQAPDAAAWTPANWNAMQWGQRRSGSAGEVRVTQLVTILVSWEAASCSGGNVPTPSTPPAGEDLSGLRRSFHPWFEHDTDTGLEGHAKDVPLNHAPSYRGGKKSARVTGFGEITQQLSPPGQGYQSNGCAVSLREADHHWRAREANEERFFNTEGRICLASDEVGRAAGTPHVVMRGALIEFTPKAGLRREAQFLDVLARDFREFGQEEPLLTEKFKDLFPDIAEDLREVRVPRRYGRYSGGLSDSPAPVPSGDPARGAVFDPVTATRLFGFESLTAGPAAPTLLTVAEEAGGTIGLTHTPYNRLGFCAWCVDGSGNEGDPYPFYESVEQTITGNGKQYRVTVTLPTGPLPAKVRVAIAGIYFRPIWFHYIEIDPSVTTQVVFTNADIWTGEGFADGGLSAGGVRITYYNLFEYALLFKYADGVSARSAVCVGPRSSAYRRPIRCSGTIPSGATPQEIIALRRPTGGEFRRMLVGPITTVDEAGRVYVVDDFTSAALQDTPERYLRPRGALPAYDTGLTESIPGYGIGWVPFCVHGAPSHAVLKIYAGSTLLTAGRYGVDVMAPGPPGSTALAAWDAAFATRYRPYGGLETTTLYLRGPLVAAHRDGSAPITVDLCAIEDGGDGWGSTIRYFGRQVFHAFNNYVFNRTKPAGSWNALATFSDGVSKLAVFVAALEAVETKQLGAPLEGHLSLEGDITPRELARLVGLHGLWEGTDEHGRLTVIRVDDTPDLSTAFAYEHVRSVMGPIDIDRRTTADMCNSLPSSGAWDYVDGAFTVVDDPYTAGDSIAKYEITMPKPTREMKFLQDAAARRDIVAREVLLFKDPPTYVGWWTNYVGRMPHSDVGRVVLLTDVEGIGANGYVQQPILLLRRRLALDRGLVYLWGLDLGRVVNKVARLTAPGQVAYTAATTTEKNRYLFLSGATGLMSDGTKAPRLR